LRAASLINRVAPGYKLALLKNEFGDVEGPCTLAGPAANVARRPS